MAEPLHERVVRDSYDEVADVYAARFGHVSRLHPLDRALVDEFAQEVGDAPGPAGQVADLGCGPGHLTGHLHARGLDVFGVDLSAAFVEMARRDHPEARFRHGSMTDLGLDDGALAGIVAWFSLIHVPPAQLEDTIAELGRLLAKGGRLLVGFQVADPGDVVAQPYDHKVAPAYRWPVDLLSDLLGRHDLVETARLVRQPGEGERVPQLALLARKIGRG